MGDVTMTRWPRFDKLVVQFEDGSPDLVIPANWDNSLRIALGLSYKYNENWKIHTGIAYDEGAFENADDRTPRIPDSDRKWISFGVGYYPSEKFNFSISYNHLFFTDGPTNYTDPITAHRLVGEFDVDTDIIAGQLLWKF